MIAPSLIRARVYVYTDIFVAPTYNIVGETRVGKVSKVFAFCGRVTAIDRIREKAIALARRHPGLGEWHCRRTSKLKIDMFHWLWRENTFLRRLDNIETSLRLSRYIPRFLLQLRVQNDLALTRIENVLRTTSRVSRQTYVGLTGVEIDRNPVLDGVLSMTLFGNGLDNEIAENALSQITVNRVSTWQNRFFLRPIKYIQIIHKNIRFLFRIWYIWHFYTFIASK